MKVLDFGLARTIARGSDTVTAHHLLGGTPVYIAPERIRDPAKVDARSDIYSLGGVAFYLLTAKEIVEGSSAQEIFLRTMHLEGRRPSGPRPDGIPVELDELVARCLALEQEDRPQSVTEILDVLDRLAIASPWSEEKARAWWADYRKKVPSRP
ncbi:MAG: protein kinase domain-containing protein [Vicinamibacteria bacterium]